MKMLVTKFSDGKYKNEGELFAEPISDDNVKLMGEMIALQVLRNANSFDYEVVEKLYNGLVKDMHHMNEVTTTHRLQYAFYFNSRANMPQITTSRTKKERQFQLRKRATEKWIKFCSTTAERLQETDRLSSLTISTTFPTLKIVLKIRKSTMTKPTRLPKPCVFLN